MCVTAMSAFSKWMGTAGNANSFNYALDLTKTAATFMSDKATAEANQSQLQGELEQLGRQREEINATTAEQLSDRARQSLIETARVRVASGESGIGGISVNNLIQDVKRSEGRDTSRIKEQGKRNLNMNAAKVNTTNAKYEGKTNPISLMNVTKLITGIGTDYATYNQAKTAKKG